MNGPSEKDHNGPSSSSSSSSAMPHLPKGLPFMPNPGAMGMPGMPQFPFLPGMFPGAAQHLFNLQKTNNVVAAATSAGENGNASSSSSSEHKDCDKEGSPSPKEGPSSAKRKKTASGSGGSTSSKDGSITTNMPPLVGCLQNNGPDKLMVKQMDKLGPLSIDHIEQMKEGLMPIPPGLLPSGPSPGGQKGSPGGEEGSPGGAAGIANYVPNQRLEWKRYKQYTRNDIMAAIEEVKAGESFHSLIYCQSVENVTLIIKLTL